MSMVWITGEARCGGEDVMCLSVRLMANRDG